MKALLSTLVLCLAFINFGYADSWRDPSWQEMLKESDAVALIEYTSNGKFRAKAIVLKVYKGSLKPNDEIWVTNFSNRYGPIDQMSKGDRYLVFVGQIKYRKKDEEYWQNRIKKDASRKPYVEAVKKGRVYYVQTPTSGDLKVKGNKVQYDLIQTSYYSKQAYYSLPEFERFLKNVFQKKPRKSFLKYLKKKSKSLKNSYQLVQYLMMLKLVGYSTYEAFYEKLINDEQIGVRYALAQLLGVQKSDKHRDLLVKLLADKNAIVQGEVVRQLAVYPANFVGPILLKRLGSSGDGGIYPQNIMDPVRNEIDGGKVQIIKTLGEIKYKPAGKKLLPLLETKNECFFKLVYNTLRQMEVKDYIPYFNKMLISGEKKVAIEICKIIADDSITVCIPAVMQFIKRPNRYENGSSYYSISPYFGVGKFDSDTLRKFWYQDFLEVMRTKDTANSDSRRQKDWLKEYLEIFEAKKILLTKDDKKKLYNVLFDFYGLSNDFKTHPELFIYKKQKEDSLAKVVAEILKDENLLGTRAQAFVKLDKSGKPFLANYKVEYRLRRKINYEKDEDILTSGKEWKVLKKINQKLIAKGIALKHILANINNVGHLFEAGSIEEFDVYWYEHFFDYILLFPDKGDLSFMQGLQKHYFTDEFDLRHIKKRIEVCRKKIGD